MSLPLVPISTCVRASALWDGGSWKPCGQSAGAGPCGQHNKVPAQSTRVVGGSLGPLAWEVVAEVGQHQP